MTMSTDYQAAQWWLRQEQGLDQAGEIALQQWLAAHPSHKIAWTEMMDVDALLGQLPASQTAALSRDVRTQIAKHAEPAFWSRCWQRTCNVFPQMAIASCAMVVLVCSLLWFDQRQQAGMNGRVGGSDLCQRVNGAGAGGSGVFSVGGGQKQRRGGVYRLFAENADCRLRQPIAL